MSGPVYTAVYRLSHAVPVKKKKKVFSRHICVRLHYVCFVGTEVVT